MLSADNSAPREIVLDMIGVGRGAYCHFDVRCLGDVALEKRLLLSLTRCSVKRRLQRDTQVQNLSIKNGRKSEPQERRPLTVTGKRFEIQELLQKTLEQSSRLEKVQKKKDFEKRYRDLKNCLAALREEKEERNGKRKIRL